MSPPPLECQHHRSTLSAALDGEARPAERAAAELHLAGCPDCRTHAARLTRLQVLVATTTPPPSPDLVPALAPAIASFRPGPAGTPPAPAAAPAPASLARFLLAAVAGTQLVFGGAALLAGVGAEEVHTSRHLGAWAVAFAVGMLLTAVRPHHARTLLPIAATLTLAVTVGTVVDLVSGARHAAPEALHLLEFVGLALLAVVHRRARAARPPAGGGPAVPLPVGGV